jgi:nucleoside-diphosphate-sugar epimerase
MQIAILGANSHIAKDLIKSFSCETDYNLILFCRRPAELMAWQANSIPESNYKIYNYEAFENWPKIDIIINFVGSGDPAKTSQIGKSIIDITDQYDEMSIGYVRKNPSTKYIFISSGAIYGENFSKPANARRNVTLPINDLTKINSYSLAKLFCEIRHRALYQYSIVDLRIFSYFSSTQSLTANFLMSQISNSIINNKILKTSQENITRDFLHPHDFFNLVLKVITTGSKNCAIDCYSKAPIDKLTLLTTLRNNYGLCYEMADIGQTANPTGEKTHYYSTSIKGELIFQYKPSLTSLEGILLELNKILLHHPTRMR